MPTEPEPADLARLIDFAERPRVDDWSLRSALVRYAQPRAEQVSSVLELVRRIDAALSPDSKLIERNGPALWGALQAGETPPSEPEATIVGILRSCEELDQLADQLAAWAADPSRDRPDDAVDATVATVEAQLDALGVAHEDRQRPLTRRG